MTNSLESLLAKQDITELIYRYMRGLDRWDDALLRSLFTEDAWCEYGFTNCGANAFVDFALDALSTHTANHHFVGNILIDIDGDQAYGEVYFNAYHKVEGPEGHEDVIIAGRYLDRYALEAGEWKIAYRSEVVDFSRTMRTNDPYFQLAPDGIVGGRRDDPLYDITARHKTVAGT